MNLFPRLLGMTRRLRATAHVVDGRVHKLTGRVPHPRVAWLIPTWFCDLKCLTCSVWRRPRDPNDLNVEQWRAILQKVQFLDIVKLLGGEPFTRDDIVELGVAIQEIVQPMILQTVTAGKETDRVVAFAEAVGAPNLHLRVSIDGLGAVHERLRGTPGLHQKALNTLDQLLPIRDRTGFQLGVNVAVNDETLPYLDDLHAFCKERNINIAPGLAVSPFLEEVDLRVKRPKVIMAQDREAIGAALKRLSARGDGGYRIREALRLGSWNEGIWQDMLDGKSSVVQGKQCEALRSFFYILPDGGIAACGLKQKAIGTLRDQSFHTLWYGAEAMAKRDEVRECVGCLQHSATVFTRLYGGS